MSHRILGCVIVCAVITHTSAALAQVAEVRAGLTEFDERSLNLPGSIKYGDENSIGINAEIIFEEPKILKWALSPQPYVNGTLNLGGKTSFAGAGLMWRQNLGDTFYADIAFGGVIHDGTKDIRITEDITAENANRLFSEASRRLRTEKEFGSRLLFREQITLGARINEDWAGEVFVEHLSNAWIPTSGINDGVNNIGVKVARRF